MKEINIFTDTDVKSAPLFQSDASGTLTHVRGVVLPRGIIHTVTVGSLNERSPSHDAASIVRGAYNFARCVQGK